MHALKVHILLPNFKATTTIPTLALLFCVFMLAIIHTAAHCTLACPKAQVHIPYAQPWWPEHHQTPATAIPSTVEAVLVGGVSEFLTCLLCAQVRVDLRYVCNHLIKWRLLNKEFNLPDLAYMAVFAKQTSGQPDQFVLQPHPLDLDYE